MTHDEEVSICMLEIPNLLQLLNTTTRSHEPFSVYKPIYAIRISTTGLGRMLKYKY